MTLEEIKLYIRIDGEDEDDLLASLQNAAEEYLLGAGIEKNYSAQIYKLTVKMLIANWYENRNMTEKSHQEVPYGVKMLIIQQQYKGE